MSPEHNLIYAFLGGKKFRVGNVVYMIKKKKSAMLSLFFFSSPLPFGTKICSDVHDNIVSSDHETTTFPWQFSRNKIGQMAKNSHFQGSQVRRIVHEFKIYIFVVQFLATEATENACLIPSLASQSKLEIGTKIVGGTSSQIGRYGRWRQAQLPGGHFQAIHKCERVPKTLHQMQ